MVKNSLDYNLISNLAKHTDLVQALEHLLKAYKESDSTENPLINLAFFGNSSLGILECVVKYLKENSGLNYSQIAELLCRDDRTIWATYQNACKKCLEDLPCPQESFLIPVSIFRNRALGPLEALTLYLKTEFSLSFNQISKELARDYRTVWLSYQNALKKRKNNEY